MKVLSGMIKIVLIQFIKQFCINRRSKFIYSFCLIVFYFVLYDGFVIRMFEFFVFIYIYYIFIIYGLIKGFFLILLGYLVNFQYYIR